MIVKSSWNNAMLHFRAVKEFSLILLTLKIIKTKKESILFSVHSSLNMTWSKASQDKLKSFLRWKSSKWKVNNLQIRNLRKHYRNLLFLKLRVLGVPHRALKLRPQFPLNKVRLPRWAFKEFKRKEGQVFSQGRFWSSAKINLSPQRPRIVTGTRIALWTANSKSRKPTVLITQVRCQIKS